MPEPLPPMHYVCTHAEARALAGAHERFWVSNCGCRERRGNCARSRMDVCLMFVESDHGSGSGWHAVTRQDVDAIFLEADTRRLVTRPFRNATRTETDGVCFCCDDCCGYFLSPDEPCDRGHFIEQTDLAACTHCGDCVEVCHFDARHMRDARLAVTTANCYGCGLCAEVCPPACIAMMPRG